MTNLIMPKAKEKILTGQINLLTDTIRAVLIDLADYTFSAAHEFLADVPGVAREETSTALTGKSVTSGVFDADDVTFSGASGDPSEALYLFKDTGNEASSPLLAYWDTAAGLPITLNGGNVVVAWPNSGNRIFAI
jgi:hypothetical protein